MEWAVGFLAFLISFALSCWTGLRLAVHLTHGWNRFWAAVAAGYLELTTIALSLSVVRLLQWEAFLPVQVAVAAAVWYWTGTPITRELGALRPRVRALKASAGGFSLVVAVLLIFVVFCSLLTRVVVPLYGYDGLSYVAPRAPYWLQQSHIGYYTTPEPRQLGSSFAGDYLFLWGIMFTSSELIGRVAYWLGYPLAVVGSYTISDRLGGELDTKLSAAALFAATPIVWAVTTLLQPFLWVLLFAFGAGYWILRQESVSMLSVGLFIGLCVSAKQQTLAALSGGAAVSIVRDLDRRQIISTVSLFCAFTGTVLLTGYVLIPARNLVEFGTLFNPVTGKVTPPLTLHAIYVKSVRLLFVLVRFPIPIPGLNEQLAAFGQSMLELLGASGSYDGWDGTYRFWLPTLPREGFGLLGVLLLLLTPYPVYRAATRIRDVGDLRYLLTDSTTHYALLAGSLLFGPLVILEVTNTGNSTQTYLGPGILLLFPLLFVVGIDRVRGHQNVYRVLKVAIVLYLLFFAAFAGNRAFDNAIATGGSIEVIDRADPDMFQPAVDRDNPSICSHPLVEERVPVDGTLIVFSNTNTYPLFGEGYQRHLVPVDTQFTPAKLESVRRQYPDAYLYVTESHSGPDGSFHNRQVIQNSSATVLLGSATADCPSGERSTWLYGFRSS